MKNNQDLIDTFLHITSIPRASGGEAALRDELIRNAIALGFAWRQDQAGNLAIFIPPSPGMEKVPGILLQAHMDMVCVADPEVQHDFRFNPIRVVERDGWLTAVGTSLGADNGVGCAMALSIARERDLKHGPLELLFSVEEETGMRGMQRLLPVLIDGTVRFGINLDFEAEDYICIGCAGGLAVSAEAVLPTQVQAGDPRELFSAWKLRAHGVQGGHSGIDIDARPINLHYYLFNLLDQFQACLLDYEGGEAINAIPSWANLTFAVPRANEIPVQDMLIKHAAAFQSLYAHPGGKPVLEFEPLPENEFNEPFEYLPRNVTELLAGTIYSLPNGVLSRHPELGGSPQSSSSLGTLQLSSGGRLQIQMTIRSDDESEAADLKNIIFNILGKLPGVSFKSDGYPVWQPETDARLVKHCQERRKGLFPGDATLVSVHAGIECSLLAAKRPDIQVVSIGPNIEGVHSTRERASLISMSRVYAWLQTIVSEIGNVV
jgi:dipeptidase D